MNWKHKALLQLAFSKAPFGEHLNYFCQKHVTKSLPISDAEFTSTLSIAMKHINAVRHYYHQPLGEALFYEYGAGWDMIVPLALYASGVENQILVDLRYLLRPKLVNDTIEKYQRVGRDFSLPRKPDRNIGGRQYASLALLKKYYGIEYRAPCDARRTGLVANSIDCITSTNTLEHIPPQDIQEILGECYRILRDDGLMSFRIDYQDHYSYFDKGISVYNFLQYSDKAWTVFSPALHYQNRLRHRDYLDLFQRAGFEVVKDRHMEATGLDLKTIERLPLDRRFKEYSLPELGVRNAHFVVHKRPTRQG